jgi:hypothetical protein
MVTPAKSVPSARPWPGSVHSTLAFGPFADHDDAQVGFQVLHQDPQLRRTHRDDGLLALVDVGEVPGGVRVGQLRAAEVPPGGQLRPPPHLRDQIATIRAGMERREVVTHLRESGQRPPQALRRRPAVDLVQRREEVDVGKRVRHARA